MKKLLSLIMCVTLLFSLIACNGTPEKIGGSSKNLMADISPAPVKVSQEIADYDSLAYYNFAVKLFKENQVNGDNVLISPLSVICALSMTANGAQGETLKEMEDVFGMTADEMNKFLYSYINGLEQGENFSLKLANSLWVTDSDIFSVNRDYLQINADYHNPQVYSVPFDDDTLKHINNWCKDKTDGMIKKVIDEFPEDANTVMLMCLINALAFEAEWETVYNEYQVHDGNFFDKDGKCQDAEFMYCDEYSYIHDDMSTGFIKYYAGREYAFVAVLPNENVTLESYISSLSGERIATLLGSAVNTKVETKMPKFEYSYGSDINDMLKNMGMERAFDREKAELQGIGTFADGNIFISKIIHKTFISVAEKGTRAGAVTAELLCGDSGAPEMPLKVYLDRPFMYMIIDCKNNVPFFIGTLSSME